MMTKARKRKDKETLDSSTRVLVNLWIENFRFIVRFIVTLVDNHGLSKDITEAVMWRCSLIKVFFNILQNSHENDCVRVFLSH